MVQNLRFETFLVSYCEYLWSLFLPELHLSFYKSLSPACLLLQSFLQFLPSSSLLLQSLSAHLHLTLLRYEWHPSSDTHIRMHGKFWLGMARYPVLEEPLFLNLGLSE